MTCTELYTSQYRSNDVNITKTNQHEGKYNCIETQLNIKITLLFTVIKKRNN